MLNELLDLRKKYAVEIFDLDMTIEIKYRGRPDGPVLTKSVTARSLIGPGDHQGYLLEARPDTTDALIVKEVR